MINQIKKFLLLPWFLSSADVILIILITASFW